VFKGTDTSTHIEDGCACVHYLCGRKADRSHGLCHLRPLEKNRWGGVGEGPEKLGRTDNDDEAGLEFWLTGSVTGL